MEIENINPEDFINNSVRGAPKSLEIQAVLTLEIGQALRIHCGCIPGKRAMCLVRFRISSMKSRTQKQFQTYHNGTYIYVKREEDKEKNAPAK